MRYNSFVCVAALCYELLLADQQESGQSPSTSQAAKCRRLEDLFRPPIDLLVKGSFHAVCSAFVFLIEKRGDGNWAKLVGKYCYDCKLTVQLLSCVSADICSHTHAALFAGS